MIKSLEELKSILASELEANVSKGLNEDQGYYNKSLGDVSFIFAALLSRELEKNNWESDKWLDDGLITKVENDGSEYWLWGNMIWGRKGTTEQWVSPFYFYVKLNDKSVSIDNYKILYGIKEAREVSYSSFIRDRGMFDKEFYTSDNWDILERDWKYEISTK